MYGLHGLGQALADHLPPLAGRQVLGLSVLVCLLMGGYSGLWVVLLASLIAVLAGLMIFPVLAATGIDPASGPGLTFMTMPAVFNHLPFGQGLAVIFFLLLLVAALSSSISMLEHLVRFTTEEWGWSRRNGGLPVHMGLCRI